jgi:ABC-type polysaccharide/polyol phosphate export permease
VRALLQSLRRNRRLLKDLVRRDLRARYVGSSMGFFWSVLFPIINLFVYMFVFRLVLKARWSDHQSNGEVALLMLSGIMVWQAFAESTSRMTNTLPDNANLIQKVVFPSEILPVYLTLSALINMMIGLVVAIGGVIYFAYGPPDKSVTEAVAVPIVYLPVPPAVGKHAAEYDLTSAFAFRCASNAGETHYSPNAVVDTSKPVGDAAGAAVEAHATAWNQPAGGWTSGLFAAAGWSDIVYASTGEWARVQSKNGFELTVDRWRNAAGEPTSPPRDGTQALVAAMPEPPLGIGLSLVCLPFLVALQSVFMLGLGCFLATFNLFLRDTYHLIGVFLTVWMFATPIFYPERMVRDAGYGWFLDLNPMHWLIQCYRRVLVYGGWPDLQVLGIFALVSLVVLVAGSSFFMAQKPRFPDLL